MRMTVNQHRCRVLVKVEPPVLGDVLARRLAREPSLVVTRAVAPNADAHERWDIVITTHDPGGAVRVEPGPSRSPSSSLDRIAVPDSLDEVVADVLRVCARQSPHRE